MISTSVASCAGSSTSRRVSKLPIAAQALALRAVTTLLGSTYRYDEPAGWAGRLPQPSILALWHHQIGAAAHLVRKRLTAADRQALIMASHSQDGELVSRIALAWGVRVVRGSASRGGSAGLRALYRELARHASCAIIFPDGPKGPRHECKPGAIVLSQMARAPILPAGLLCRRTWRLRSWDRMEIPKPGARIRLVVAPLLEVPRQLSDDRREQLRLELEDTLNRLSATEPDGDSGVSSISA